MYQADDGITKTNESDQTITKVDQADHQKLKLVNYVCAVLDENTLHQTLSDLVEPFERSLSQRPYMELYSDTLEKDLLGPQGS